MLWSDLKFAVRGLIGAPGLSAAAVLALTLGIGPNTAIFSIVYATLLAPLPFPDPDQLVRVSPMVGDSQSRTSPAEYLEWKERATSFQSLEAFWPGRALSLATPDAPERVLARQVTPGGHRIFGEGIWRGRDFRADEGQPGKQYVVLLSFWNRTRVDLGIRTDHILTFGLPVNNERFSSAAEIDGFYRQLLERLQAVPGVAAASVSSGLPLLGLGVPREFSVVGRPEDQRSLRPTVGIRMVTPEFFETFGIRTVQGRALTDRDGSRAQRVAVVNERFVRLFLDGRDPMGQHVSMDDIVAQTGNRVLAGGIPSGLASGSRVEWQIVGVFRDVSNVEQFGEPKAPEMYVPFAQSPWPQAMVAVRTTTRPELLRSSLAAAVNTVDPALPLVDVRTMEQIVGERLAPDGFNIVLYGGLAALALVLATLGIHAVMAFTVVQRTAEIGLRMALGAGHNQVRLQILREGATLATGGLVLGLVGAYALGRAMQAMLFGTGALSVPVVLVAGLILVGAALVACYVPARRASAVDPLIALRQ